MDAYDIALKVFEARLTNDAQAVAAHFHDDVEYCISGDSGSSRLPCETCEPGGFKMMLPELCEMWPWRGLEVLDVVADGDRAAIRYRLTVEHAPSARLMDTVVFDLIEARDGRVTRLVEHVDTAHVERVASAA